MKKVRAVGNDGVVAVSDDMWGREAGKGACGVYLDP